MTVYSKPALDEIERSVQLLAPRGSVTELRAFNVSTSAYTKPHVEAGYFDDFARLSREVFRLGELAGSSVYMLLNPAQPELLARAKNSVRVATRELKLTTDSEILRRRWLFVDLDPVRPPKTSSTGAQHERALVKARTIAATLQEKHWPEPIIIDSGNGAQILYSVDLPNDDSTGRLFKRVLAALATNYDDADVVVDPSVCNASRLIKIPGTVARKGNPTRERPHRCSRIISVPHRHELLSAELLERIALPTPSTSFPQHPANQISAGTRHNRLLSFAGTMIRKGMEEREIAAALLQANVAWCDPPLEEDEVRNLAADVVHRYGGTSTHEAEEEEAPIEATVDAAAFPTGVLPKSIREFVCTAATALSCPPDYIAVPTLAILGYANGTKRRLEIKPGWQEASRLYTAVVGPPGATKSPALRLAAEPLMRLQRKLLKDYEHSKQLNPGGVPTLLQAFTTDSTLESMAMLLKQNSGGIVFLRDELSGWAQAMDQYRNGKGADREAWLSIWSGSPLVINRKNLPEPLTIPDPFVTVVGCLPPDMLGDLSDERGREDGFLHRILFTFPLPTYPRWTDEGVPVQLLDEYCRVFEEIRRPRGWDSEAQQVLHFTKEGQRAFVAWIHQHNNEIPSLPPHLHGLWAKFPIHFVRLALILQTARRFSGESLDENVDEATVAGTVELVAYFKSHARKICGRLSATKGERRVDDVFQWVRRQQGGRATVRNVLTAKVGGCLKSAEVTDVFQRIERLGLGNVVETQPEHGGRKSIVLQLNAVSVQHSPSQERGLG